MNKLFFSTLILTSTLAHGEIARVTTISPFPRGLAMVDGDLYVLSRGRVRGAGGVSSDVNDRAGTIFRVDPNLSEPISNIPVSPEIQNNGATFALPTSPPFNLWNTSSDPPWKDRETDRPYCGLRWHEPTSSFYICAFSGVDKPAQKSDSSFSKNLTDAILRYDLRTEKWYEAERHNIEAGGIYPHHDPAYSDPPHGWLNGPDNLLPVGNSLYAVAKDNSVMIRYDLTALIDDPEAGPPSSEWVMGSSLYTTNAGPVEMTGHSALALRNDWLYVASRTSSHIVRIRLEGDQPAKPLEVELLAEFDPWTYERAVEGLRPSDLTDMDFDDQGRLYIVSAKPAAVYRFTPDPTNIFNGRDGATDPWLDVSTLTNNQKMKSENIMINDQNRLFITSGDGYDFQYGANGTVYRFEIQD